MMDEENKKLVGIILKEVDNIKWKKIDVVFPVSKGAMGIHIKYNDSNDTYKKLYPLNIFISI